MVFVAFYAPQSEPTDYSNHPYKCGCLNYIMGLLSIDVFYVVSEVTKSWSMEVS
jgi:hypothetical protein